MRRRCGISWGSGTDVDPAGAPSIVDLEPMRMATRLRPPSDEEGWVAEIKYDYRPHSNMSHGNYLFG